jgi:DNA-binding beta-propeller fold protein YncE
LAKYATSGINASAKLNKSKFTITSLDMPGAPWDKVAVNPTANTIYVTNATTDYSHHSTGGVIDGNTNKVMANNLKCSTKDKGVNKKYMGIIFMNEGLLIIQISS